VVYFPGLGLISGQLLSLSSGTSGSNGGGNVTVIVTATGGTATATGGAADATGGMNENNDNDTNTATNTGRKMMNEIERAMKKVRSFLQNVSFRLKRNLFEQI
jgi:hypothetical protein